VCSSDLEYGAEFTSFYKYIMEKGILAME